MKPQRVVPRWPLYRFECLDCEASDTGSDLASTRSFAAIHAEDEDHDTQVLKILATYEPIVRADPVLEGTAR